MSDDYKPTDKKKDYKASESKQYNVTFKENRTFELHIRKSVYIFNPNGTMTVGESFINSPDFQQQKDHFVISEVK